MDLTCSNMYMFLQDHVMGSFSAIYPSSEKIQKNYLQQIKYW